MLVVGLLSPAGVEAANSYRFSSIAEGAYPTRAEGFVVVDGDRWRINFDRVPGAVIVMDAILGEAGKEMIAINDENHTWFTLRSRRRIAADSSLFSFGESVRISKLALASHPPAPDSDREPAGGSVTRITFSYQFEARMGSEKIRGDVWGEIRIRTTNESLTNSLPWRPVELNTGLDAVDEALRKAWAPIESTAWQCEIEVSRRLKGGVVLKQTTKRTIGSPVSKSGDALEYTVPSGYRYQEPIIGAASTSSPM